MVMETVVINGVLYQPVRPVDLKLADPTAGHSPLPWLASKDTENIVTSADVDPNVVCLPPNFSLHPNSYKSWPANRNLILRAVNNFDELVRFVEGVVSCGRCDACAALGRSLLARIRGPK